MSSRTSNCPTCGGNRSRCRCYLLDDEDEEEVYEVPTSATLTTTAPTNYLDPSQTSTAGPYPQDSWQSNTVQQGVYGPTSTSYYPPQSTTDSGSAFWNVVRTPQPAGQSSYHETQSGSASYSNYPTTAPEPSYEKYEDDQVQQPVFWRTELGPHVPITEPDPAKVQTSSFYNRGSSGVQEPCDQCVDAGWECSYVRHGKICVPCRERGIRRCTTKGFGTGRRSTKKDKSENRRRDDRSKKDSTGQAGGYSSTAVV
ncbi:hypothetical protein QBC37DRAFT_401495 [Rhypophila decipiens]|uniref:Uncharacterized protein n=1 Tax=Rhypophila decipiens TaxID=261697 RepID=A0AAN6Y5T8_9PEZI|nr:hypothetical protein QBC37DRAFT_401495 [Rhypophila decipiens]